MARWNGRQDGLKVEHDAARHVHEAFGSSIVWIPGTSATGSNGLPVFAAFHVRHLKVFVPRSAPHAQTQLRSRGTFKVVSGRPE